MFCHKCRPITQQNIECRNKAMLSVPTRPLQGSKPVQSLPTNNARVTEYLNIMGDVMPLSKTYTRLTKIIQWLQSRNKWPGCKHIWSWGGSKGVNRTMSLLTYSATVMSKAWETKEKINKEIGFDQFSISDQCNNPVAIIPALRSYPWLHD